MAHFQILHVDEYVAVVHKDAGLLTTPAHDPGEDCLVDSLERALDRQSFGRYRLSVVHRLDRQTSGLLVFARTPTAAAFLAKQFAGHRVEREYVAIASGRLAEERGTVRQSIDGKRAVTHFEVTGRRPDATAIAVRLETGRRNQIRIHFGELGHPLLGETRFKPELASHPSWPHTRLALHARVLGFLHPKTKDPMRFEAPTPPEFEIF